MNIVFAIIFIVATAIHLFASLKRNKKLRNQTKPFILLALMAFYCCSVRQIRPFVVLALFFSWLGDVLLIPDGIKWFTYGGISFMVSHFFFILSYLRDVDFSKISPLVIVFLGLFFFALVSFIFTKLKPFLPKALFWPMYLYLLINGTMNCFAIFRFLSDPSPAGVITLIGAILFFISDTALFFVRFNKNSRLKTHFLVMLTYSIGEFLIVLGLIIK